MKEVSNLKNPGEIERPPEPCSRGKAIGYAIFIILGIGGLAFAGAGAAGYFHVGVLSKISQVDALIMLSAGGGAALTGIFGVCLIKYFGRSRARVTEDASPRLERKQSYSIEEIEKMTDEALKLLTVSEVAEVDQEELLRVIGPRLVKCLDLKQLVRLPKKSPEDITKMSLADLSKISAQAINDRPSAFPPITFFLLGYQLQDIETSKLSDKQVHLLFSSKHANTERVIAYNLTLEQIKDCLPKLEDKNLLDTIFDRLLEHKGQDININQEIFDILCPVDEEKSPRIKSLNVEILYTYTPYFKEQHWLWVTGTQFKKFDFSKIGEEERKKAGQAFSSPDFKKGKLQLLQKDQFEYIKPYITNLSD